MSKAQARQNFSRARLEAVHHLALVTIVASQVLQLIGSVALWRRRLLGRTLLLTYAAVYLAALITVESMRAIDHVSTLAPASSAQHAILALSQMHLVVYGSLFPLFPPRPRRGPAAFRWPTWRASPACRCRRCPARWPAARRAAMPSRRG